MTKREKRWPIWKIAAATAGAAALAIALFGLSVFLGKAAGPATTNPSGQNAASTLPDLIVLLSTMVGVLTVLGLIWLGFRIREARLPVWERGQRRRRGRARR